MPSISPLDEGYDFYITDNWKKKYHFKILTFPIHSKMISVAIETSEETDTDYPRKIEILSDYNVDVEMAELILKAKIKKEINRKSIKLSEENSLEIIDNTLRGEILTDHDNTNFSNPLFAIDGKKISIDQFCKMLAPSCSFKFKFEIIDPSDEMP